ncbi:MAG TPA: HisA/HisF-related TIM barrel protein [Candidatus Limnocylindria bacterium]|nr:HisA/HisF-related TIM barrel protein [Candidatus Limnocylindria bacterium]
MKLIPSLDLQAGRSRLVFWPGASAGQGTPTDRPERIARHFVELGAPLLHLVDLDGAQRGAPANTEAIQRVAREVAVPLQLAGGVDGPEQIELAFACGATRVVVPLWAVAESDENLHACLGAAGDWLAVGLDGRPERLRDYPWQSGPVPSWAQVVERLAGAGVRRLVVSHWRADELDDMLVVLRGHDVELQLAGGVTDAGVLARLRAAGVDALIVGEALFNGTIDYAAATGGQGAAASTG